MVSVILGGSYQTGVCSTVHDSAKSDFNKLSDATKTGEMA